MTPLEWFVVIAAATSVPALLMIALSWWKGRHTNKIIQDGAAHTQALIKAVHDRNNTILGPHGRQRRGA